jgi:hypothetical protein
VKAPKEPQQTAAQVRRAAKTWQLKLGKPTHERPLTIAWDCRSWRCSGKGVKP